MDGDARNAEAARVLDRLRLILSILESAATLGTHKYALSLALLDAVLVLPYDNQSQIRVGVPEVADRVIDLYWEQNKPYITTSGDELVLAQLNTSAKGPHVYLAAVTSLQERFPGQSISTIRRHHVDAYLEARKRVCIALVSNPIPRFHVGFTSVQPLWEMEGTGADAQLVLGPPTVVAFALFASTIREVAERRFLDKVVALNRIDDDRAGIENHLFGAERAMPTGEMRSALASLQGDRCLYTGKVLTRPSVDHFLPWSSIHLSEIQNFVVTNMSVNSAKGPQIADSLLHGRWRSHIIDKAPELERIADRYLWPSNLERVLAAADHLYRGRNSDELWSPQVAADVSDTGAGDQVDEYGTMRRPNRGGGIP